MRYPRSSASRAGALLLAFSALALPLARGSVDFWSEAAGVVLALAALAAATVETATVPAAFLALLAVLGVAALQLLPLPPALLAVSPGAVRVFEISLEPVGLYPAARPLSLDPAGSARELAKAIACTAAFAGAWTYADTRRRRNWVLLGLGLSSVAVTAVVLGAALVGAGNLLAPRFPFLNPNHLAGFLSLTAFVALGLAFRTYGQARALWAIGFVTAGAVVFLTLSRGGMGAFFVGATVFVVLHVFTRWRREETTHPARHAALVAVLAAAVGVAAFLALDPVLAELRTLRGANDDIKVRLLAPALHLVRDFPLTGAGPGAFTSLFQGYQSESSAVTFTHLENEWVQPLVDLGIPAGLLLVGTFAWIWFAAARRKDLSPAEIGLLAGTAALVAHDVFDFSLGILGVSVPFALAMGLLARPQRGIAVHRWVLRVGVGVALFAAVGALAVGASHDLNDDRDRVDQASGASATAYAARTALRWHPADWVSHATAGTRSAAERGCSEGMPWLMRAMILDPGAPAPHLAAARCLAGRNDVAAKREYRLALMYGQPALAEAATQYPDLADLFDIAPETPDGLLSLGNVLAGADRPTEAAVAFARLIDEFSDERGVLPLAYAKALLRDHDGALKLARRHSAAQPSDPRGWLLAADCLRHLERDDDARSEVERGLAAAPGSPPLLGFLVDLAMGARRWSEAKRLAEEIAPRNPDEIAGKQLLVARTLAGQGRISEALDRARSAAGTAPEAQWPWLAIADYATNAGRIDEAITALRRAASLPGAPPDRYAPRIEKLEAAQAAVLERDTERAVLRGSASGGRLP